MGLLSMLRFWREGLIGALLIAIAVLAFGKRQADRHAAAVATQLEQARSTIDREREQIRSRTTQARAEDAAHAARVERDQSHISEEIRNDFQDQLADLRRRYDAVRLHAGASSADRSGGGGTAMSGFPDTASGADGSSNQVGLPDQDALIASEQAIRLKALQDWVRAQQKVER